MKSYKEFIKESKQSKDNIESICQRHRITHYTINSDGSIDVDGNVYLDYRELTKLPLKFRNVTGDFYCTDNKLTSLKGCPEIISGSFYCANNKLTSLQGCPEIISGSFYCANNKLTSLEGSPREVGGGFYCANNKLTSLQGCPEIIGDIIYCGNNQLINFNGIPEDFEGNIYLDKNPVEEIYNLFGTDKCIKWLNEFDVIQGDKVILDRLEEVYHQMGMRIPENIKLKHYEII